MRNKTCSTALARIPLAMAAIAVKVSLFKNTAHNLKRKDKVSNYVQKINQLKRKHKTNLSNIYRARLQYVKKAHKVR